MPERFISVDDHVQEPPDLWTARLSKRRWGDRIPHLERTPDGAERWVIPEKMRWGIVRAGPTPHPDVPTVWSWRTVYPLQLPNLVALGPHPPPSPAPA